MKKSLNMQKSCVLVLLLGSVLGSHCLTWAQTAGAPGSARASLERPRLVMQLGHSGAVIAVRCFAGQQGTVYAVAFSPDSRFILAGNRFFEVESGREVRRLEGHATSVRALAFSPDGRFVVTAGIDADQPTDTVACGMLLLVRSFERFPGTQATSRPLLSRPMVGSS